MLQLMSERLSEAREAEARLLQEVEEYEAGRPREAEIQACIAEARKVGKEGGRQAGRGYGQTGWMTLVWSVVVVLSVPFRAGRACGQGRGAWQGEGRAAATTPGQQHHHHA